MSPAGHDGSGPGAQAPAQVTEATVVTFPMPPGHVFDWHQHSGHQLAWAIGGVLTVRTATRAWALPPTRALWIPAGIWHETLSAGAATMRAVYLPPDRCALSWADCTPVTASPLLAELIGYLAGAGLAAGPRERTAALLTDLLAPVPMAAIDVRLPAPGPARQVALALQDDPADSRTLAEWGRAVGASERTLARGFTTGTGLAFGRWRAQSRLRSALPGLAAGQPVEAAARAAGYASVSAFVAAFRRETGQTPAAYFRSPG